MALAFTACSPAASERPERAALAAQAITSNEAKILELRFSAELVALSNTEARKAILSQLVYAQGIFVTAHNGNGQVGQVVLSNVVETEEGRAKRIRYDAALPVAFPKDLETPERYALALPRDVRLLAAFNRKYDGTCGKNQYGQENFWLDYDPGAAGCRIDDEDVVRASAAVAPYAKASTDKYPEYDLLWADDRLDVIALFALIEGAEPDDYGYTERDAFLRRAKERLTDGAIANRQPTRSFLSDASVTGTVEVGGRQKPVSIDVLLVPDLQRIGPDFDQRFDPISEKADLILYNGHAGLGENVNVLARKGKVAREKYQLVLLNGCQSFAHIDRTLNERRTAVNGADRDPAGTMYMDVVGNALIGYANNLAAMSFTLLDAAVEADTPRSYRSILAAMPANQLVVAFGEDDNRFAPPPLPARFRALEYSPAFSR
ncbi:MAG: hypothetical protein KF819_36515 [Labilithrix sp.]|nr:hypothetical protein [Labilithrix sp.]